MTTNPPPGNQAGFSIVEMSMVLAVMGVMTTAIASGSVGVVESKRVDTAKIKLEAIEEAIVRFAAAARRLPCPADATATGNTAIGVEQISEGTCTGEQNDGIVPWVTLGLPQEAALDPWGRLITMRVADLTANSAFPANLTFAGLRPLDSQGLDVSELTANDALRPIMRPAAVATDPLNGAAYVLISHGRDGLGGYTAARTLVAGDAVGNQSNNANNNNVNGTGTPYVMGSSRTGFDDIVHAKTISQLAVRAGLVN